MARLPEAEQRALATAAKAGESVSARQHAKKLKLTSEGKAKPAAKNIALSEFDGHVLQLLQMTGKAKPARFDREQPTKEANPARSQAHPAGRAPSVSFTAPGPVSCTREISARSSEDVGRSFEDVRVDAPLPQCRSQLIFLKFSTEGGSLRAVARAG